MSDKRLFVLANDEVRKSVALFAKQVAPTGWHVRFEPPKRNAEQNALMWLILGAFSEQLQWPVNGVMSWLEPEEFKDILSAAFNNETHRIAQGLNGGMVIFGARTSKMGKARFAEFVEFMQDTAALRGVKIPPQTEKERG